MQYDNKYDYFKSSRPEYEDDSQDEHAIDFAVEPDIEVDADKKRNGCGCDDDDCGCGKRKRSNRCPNCDE